jgi:hypothetical protein
MWRARTESPPSSSYWPNLRGRSGAWYTGLSRPRGYGALLSSACRPLTVGRPGGGVPGGRRRRAGQCQERVGHFGTREVDAGALPRAATGWFACPSHCPADPQPGPVCTAQRARVFHLGVGAACSSGFQRPRAAARSRSSVGGAGRECAGTADRSPRAHPLSQSRPHVHRGPGAASKADCRHGGGADRK